MFFISLAICGVLYLGAYWVLTGDTLRRLHVIAAFNPPEFSAGHWEKVGYFWRLLAGPMPILMSGQHFTTSFVLATPVAFIGIVSRNPLLRRLRYLAAYTLSVLLMFWFGSTSLNSYRPLSIDPRFALPIHGSLCILGGASLSLMIRMPHRAPRQGSWLTIVLASFSAGLFMVVIILTAVASTRLVCAVYLGYVVCLALTLVANWQNRMSPSLIKGIAATAFLVLTLIWPVSYRVKYGSFQSPWLQAERAIMHDQLLPASTCGKNICVMTDPLSVQVLPFYFNYELPKNIRLSDWSKPNELLDIDNLRLLVYINRARIHTLKNDYSLNPPADVESPPVSWREIVSRGGAVLYDATPWRSSAYRRVTERSIRK
jgi:hypothetical protein